MKRCRILRQAKPAAKTEAYWSTDVVVSSAREESIQSPCRPDRRVSKLGSKFPNRRAVNCRKNHRRPQNHPLRTYDFPRHDPSQPSNRYPTA